MNTQTDGTEETPRLTRAAKVIGGITAVIIATAGMFKAIGENFPFQGPPKETYIYQNKQALEHGTYPIKDGSISLILKIGEVSAKRNLVEISLSTDPSASQIVEVPIEKTHYFVAGENQYAITVNDLADVANGTDTADITLKKK